MNQIFLLDIISFLPEIEVDLWREKNAAFVIVVTEIRKVEKQLLPGLSFA